MKASSDFLLSHSSCPATTFVAPGVPQAARPTSGVLTAFDRGGTGPSSELGNRKSVTPGKRPTASELSPRQLCLSYIPPLGSISQPRRRDKRTGREGDTGTPPLSVLFLVGSPLELGSPHHHRGPKLRGGESFGCQDICGDGVWTWSWAPKGKESL